MTVIVTELDQDIIARLHGGINLGPNALIDAAARAQSVFGIIDDLHVAIHEIAEKHAPATLGIAVGEVLVGHGRIPHQMQGERTGRTPDKQEKDDLFHKASPLIMTSSKVIPSA